MNFDLWPPTSLSIQLLIFDLRMFLMMHHSMWSHLFSCFLHLLGVTMSWIPRCGLWPMTFHIRFCINGSLTFDLRMSLMMHHSVWGHHSLVPCTYWEWRDAGFQAVVRHHSDWIDYDPTQALVCCRIQQWEGRPCSSPSHDNVSGWSESKQRCNYYKNLNFNQDKYVWV